MSWNFLGNENAVALLKEQTRPEKLRHSYLLTGPQGVGRRTLALAMIKALNCANPPSPGEFCDDCLPCRQINAHTFSDLTILTPPAGSRELRIDQVRRMQQTLALAPFQSRYRVVLIPDFQNATVAASNALLKSLEEPPARAVIILTADARESLLETIASRCEHLRLHPLSIATAEKELIEVYGLAPERAQLLAHLTGGRIGAALDFERDPLAVQEHSAALADLEDLLGSNKRQRLQYVERLSRQKKTPRDKFRQLISVWLNFWRDVMITCRGADLPLVNLEKADLVRATAGEIDAGQADQLLRLHEDALGQLDAYVNPRMVIEYVLLSLPRVEVAKA